jgi:hypothetical protein
MTQGQRLPNRRGCESFSFQGDGLSYVRTLGCFPNSDVAEVFLSNHKNGSDTDTDTAARDSAITASLGLQYGLPLHVLRRALLHDPRGKAMSPLGADIAASSPAGSTA